MGKTVTTHKYEITPQIKELQALAQTAHIIGYEVNVDITQDLVTINNIHKFTYATAKPHLEKLIADSKVAKGMSDFPDREQEAKEAKLAAKRAKKHREPGAPPELKTIIRRAKRIYKKAIIKGLPSAEASAKATTYIEKKATPEDLPTAASFLVNYITKEQA